MKRKVKKSADTKAKSRNKCFYVIAVLVAVFVVVGGCIIYSMCIINDVFQPNGISSDTDTQLVYISEARRLIENGLYHVIFSNKHVPNLVKLLSSSNSTIQEKATKTLMYLTKEKEKFALAIINEGAVPPLLQNLHSSNESVSTMSLITLYFMVYEKPSLGLKLVTMGLDKHLVKIINTSPSKETLNVAITIILHLYSQKESSAVLHQSATMFLPSFKKLLRHPDDEIVRTTAATLIALTENAEGQPLPLVFDNEMIKILIHLLDNKDTDTSHSALLVLMYMVNSANAQYPLNPDEEILDLIPSLLNTDKEAVIQVGLILILKSIIHPSFEQTAAVFDANLIPLVVEKLTDKSSAVRSQAAAILSTAAHQGRKTHLSILLDVQIIPDLYNILVETNEDDTKRMIVRALDLLIQFADREMKENIYEDFVKRGAFKEFSKLLKHETRLISKWTQSILDSFSSENLISVVA